MKITKETLKRLIKEELEIFAKEGEADSLETRMKRVMALPDLSLDEKMKEIMSLLNADPAMSAKMKADGEARMAAPDMMGLDVPAEELNNDDKMRQSLRRRLEELDSLMNEEPTHDGSYGASTEEFFDGQIWLPQGEEDRRDDKFALKVVDVLSNSVNIEFLGNGYKKFKVGETKMLTKDSLKKRYVERSVDGYGKHQHTLSLDEGKTK